MAHIIILLGGKVIQRRRLDKEIITIGRADGNDIKIDNLGIGNRLAQIKTSNSQFVLIDVGGENGVMVNGKATSNHVLKESDLVELGKFRLAFHSDDETDSEASHNNSESFTDPETSSTIQHQVNGGSVHPGFRRSNADRYYHDFSERNEYLDSIRSTSIYPAFRFVTTLGKFVFYMFAAIILIMTLSGLFAKNVSIPWALSGLMLSVLLAIVGKAAAEASLIFADMADAIVDMSSRNSNDNQST